jgi:ATP-dependent Clp protease ATP-binding subunit ClpX
MLVRSRVAMHKQSPHENPIAMIVESVYATDAEKNASERIVSWMEDAARTPTELEGMLRGITTAFKSYLRRRDLKVPTTRCTFCRKGEDDVKFLVAASEVAICDECVRIAAQVIEERGTPKAPSPSGRGAKAALLDFLTRSKRKG